MGKGIVHVYNHRQCNYTYPSTNTKLVLPPCSASSPKNDSTNYCGAAMIALNQSSHVSHITTKNKFDTNVKNCDDSQYFETPRKIDHSNPDILDMNTTTA